jgi:hypothetical protein
MQLRDLHLPPVVSSKTISNLLWTQSTNVQHRSFVGYETGKFVVAAQVTKEFFNPGDSGLYLGVSC